MNMFDNYNARDVEADTEMRQYVSAREFYIQTPHAQAHLDSADMLGAMIMAREFEIQWRKFKNDVINRGR